MSIKDILSINILNNDIHNLFKCIDFNSRQIYKQFKYSFKNISNLGLDRINAFNLSNTNVTELRVFRKVHTLDLSSTKVTDVSVFANVHTLDFKLY